MHDYNGDGRSDAHDAAIFHNVINSSGGGGGSSGGGGGSGGGIAGVLAALVIMELFKPGRIFDGGFAALIWLICASYLLLRLACWIESL